MVFIIILLAIFTGGSITCFVLQYLKGSYLNDGFSIIGGILMLFAFIVLLVLTMFIMGSVEVRTFNRLYDKNYTAEEWFCSGSLIKQSVIDLKDNKIHIEIDK